MNGCFFYLAFLYYHICFSILRYQVTQNRNILTLILQVNFGFESNTMYT